MKNIMMISRGINVVPLALELKRQPQLWNQQTSRTVYDGSPHAEVDDIWVRFAGSFAATNGGEKQHESVWLPPSDLLPSAKSHARAIMSLVQGDSLGGVLITKVPPGGKVHPHTDLGWHAEHYDKFILQVEAHPQQAFCYDDGQFVTASGDLYWFHNQATHWVINDSPVDRISMIVCVKLEKPFGGM